MGDSESRGPEVRDPLHRPQRPTPQPAPPLPPHPTHLHPSPRQTLTGASCPRSGVVCLKERKEVNFPKKVLSALEDSALTSCHRHSVSGLETTVDCLSLYVGLEPKYSGAQVGLLVSQQTFAAGAACGCIESGAAPKPA